MRRTLVLALLAALACGRAEPGPTAVGTLERDRIELVAESQEPILEIAVREGDPVGTGDVLMRLDDERLAAQVRRVASARDRARARLAELVRGPRSEQLREAEARLAGAESALVTAEADLKRTQSLVEQGVAASERLDRDRARRDDALANRDAARALLDQLEEGTTSEELQQARASLAEAEAALSDLRVRLERLTVRAPRPGVIDALPYEVGERPPAGSVVVVMLADMAPYARVYVPEPLRVSVRPGQIVAVHVDGVATPFAARVRMVAHDPVFTPYFALTERDRRRLSYLAEIDLTDPKARDLPSGVPVEVVFDTPALAATESESDG